MKRSYKKIKPEDIPSILKLRAKGVSQKDIAKALGFSQSNISRCERNAKFVKEPAKNQKVESPAELKVVPNLELCLKAIAKHLKKLVELETKKLELDGLRYKAQKDYHEKREAQYLANKQRYGETRKYFGGESWS